MERSSPVKLNLAIEDSFVRPPLLMVGFDSFGKFKIIELSVRTPAEATWRELATWRASKCHQKKKEDTHGSAGES